MHDESETRDYFYPIMALCVLLLIATAGGGIYMLFRFQRMAQQEALMARAEAEQARRLAEDQEQRAQVLLKQMELANLDGDYALISGEEDGKKLTEQEIKKGRLVLKGTDHTVTLSDGTLKGTHQINPTGKPKTIDSKQTEGRFKDQTLLGTYELKGDIFKVCFNKPGRPRPTDFTQGDIIHEWQRVKK